MSIALLEVFSLSRMTLKDINNVLCSLFFFPISYEAA